MVGEGVITDGGRDGRDRRLTAHELACDLVEGAGENFNAFCTIVEDVQETILRVGAIE